MHEKLTGHYSSRENGLYWMRKRQLRHHSRENQLAIMPCLFFFILPHPEFTYQLLPFHHCLVNNSIHLVKLADDSWYIQRSIICNKGLTRKSQDRKDRWKCYKDGLKTWNGKLEGTYTMPIMAYSKEAAQFLIPWRLCMYTLLLLASFWYKSLHMYVRQVANDSYSDKSWVYIVRRNVYNTEKKNTRQIGIMNSWWLVKITSSSIPVLISKLIQ